MQLGDSVYGNRSLAVAAIWHQSGLARAWRAAKILPCSSAILPCCRDRAAAHSASSRPHKNRRQMLADLPSHCQLEVVSRLGVQEVLTLSGTCKGGRTGLLSVACRRPTQHFHILRPPRPPTGMHQLCSSDDFWFRMADRKWGAAAGEPPAPPAGQGAAAARTAVPRLPSALDPNPHIPDAARLKPEATPWKAFCCHRMSLRSVRWVRRCSCPTCSAQLVAPPSVGATAAPRLQTPHPAPPGARCAPRPCTEHSSQQLKLPEAVLLQAVAPGAGSGAVCRPLPAHLCVRHVQVSAREGGRGGGGCSNCTSAWCRPHARSNDAGVICMFECAAGLLQHSTG